MEEKNNKETNKEVDNKKENNKKNEDSDVVVKTNTFKKIWYSITGIEKYPMMSAEGFGRALKYFALLVLILVIVFSTGMVYDISGFVNSGKEYFINEFPDLTYNNGVLDVKSEETIYLSDESSIFGNAVITTTDDENIKNTLINELKEKNESAVIILKDSFIIKNQDMDSYITYTYSELFDEMNISSFTKSDIVNYINSSSILWIYLIIFLIVLLYLFALYFIINIINVIFLSILGYFTTIIARMKMRYVAIFNMAIYATTLSILLNTIYVGVNIFIDFNIEYFQVMYISVASIYLIASIFLFKSEIIKKQFELMKVMEVQEQVKKELEEKEEQEKANKEREKVKKKDKEINKKEEKEKQDSNDDEEPEGSNA